MFLDNPSSRQPSFRFRFGAFRASSHQLILLQTHFAHRSVTLSGCRAHSSFFILHSSLFTLHSSLFTLHSSLALRAHIASLHSPVASFHTAVLVGLGGASAGMGQPLA